MVYGFDTCYTRFFVVNHFKHRYKKNIILDCSYEFDKECIEKLYDFIKYYGNDMPYTLIN